MKRTFHNTHFGIVLKDNSIICHNNVTVTITDDWITVEGDEIDMIRYKVDDIRFHDVFDHVDKLEDVFNSLNINWDEHTKTVNRIKNRTTL